jgi:dTDP-4-amino-4,6-dideoxygalactose transaminase
MNQIPFLDIITPHQELEDQFIEVLRSALKSGRFIGGPMVEDFEGDFARFCDSLFCVGVGSGTDALRFALIAAGVKQCEAVITVPNTFIATTEAISQVNAIPLFVDIDEHTYNIDTEKLKGYLETSCDIDDQTGKPRIKNTNTVISAIIPVHLYGQPADMDSIQEIAGQYNLIVIEDACQAHGAGYFSKKKSRWRKAGSMGKAAAFSFYAGKNLGACGEGGAVTTDDEELAQRVRMLRDHGQARKYYHEMEGYNGRLDAIHAGILQIKLRHLPKWNEQRLETAYRYYKLLKEVDSLKIPYEPKWTRPVYHLYIIRTQNRDEMQKYLSDYRISTGLHYPIPLHLQKAYKSLGYGKGSFPVAEKIATEILSLPMYPGLTDDQQKRVVETIKEFINKKQDLQAKCIRHEVQG